MTIGDGQLIIASDHLAHANTAGEAEMAASTVLTISGGVVTNTQNFHRIAGEGGADDALDTITAAADVGDGYVLVLRPSSDTVTITLKHGTGNIQCLGNADIILDDDHDLALLVYDSNLTAWLALGLTVPLVAGALASDAVTTAKIDDDAVDDTKVGNRVPQFYRRQGGDASAWGTAGVTTYTPTTVRMQGGVVNWTGVSANSGSVVVTFPTAFSAAPLVFITPTGTAGIFAYKANTGGNAAEEFSCSWNSAANHTNLGFIWLAIGPE